MNTKLRVKPKMNYRCVVRSRPPLESGKIYTAEIASNQPNYIENGLIFCGGYLLSKGEYTIIQHKTK